MNYGQRRKKKSKKRLKEAQITSLEEVLRKLCKTINRLPKALQRMVEQLSDFLNKLSKTEIKNAPNGQPPRDHSGQSQNQTSANDCTIPKVNVNGNVNAEEEHG